MFKSRLLFIDLLMVGALFATTAVAFPDEIQHPDPGRTIKVFLCAGQSNMEGRADGTKLTQLDRERLSLVQSRVQLAFNREAIRVLDAVRPSKEIAALYERELIFGPELFFGISVAETWADEKILIIKYSAGATSLHGCWNPDWHFDKAAVLGEENEPRLYEQFISYVKEVLSILGDDEYEICGMLWVQGETDSRNPIAAAAYGDNLQELIRQIRIDLHQEALPFLMFQVGNRQVVEGMKSAAVLHSQVTLLPQSKDPASTDFYPRMENGHYNYHGMKKLGHRFADSLLRQAKQNHAPN